MPTSMTFESLKTTIRSYIERGSDQYDPTTSTQIPVAINLTERRLARELKIQGFQVAVVSEFQADLGTYQKPDRWRETISFNFGTNIALATTFNQRTPLKQLAYEAALFYWPDATETAEPKFYSDYDYQHWLITPTPDQAYPFEVLYWELPALLDDNTQTNWLTDYAPNALLHGCLQEMFGYLRNPEQYALWGREYDRDMGALNGEDMQKILDRFYKRQTS